MSFRASINALMLSREFISSITISLSSRYSKYLWRNSWSLIDQPGFRSLTTTSLNVDKTNRLPDILWTLLNLSANSLNHPMPTSSLDRDSLNIFKASVTGSLISAIGHINWGGEDSGRRFPAFTILSTLSPKSFLKSS